MLHREHPVVVAAPGRIELESLPFEGFQGFGIVDSAFQRKTCHLAAAHLRIDDDGFQPVAFVDPELRGDDPHLAGEAPPVEKAFHLAAGQIQQHATVGLDFADETVGEALPPEVETCLLLLARQDGLVVPSGYLAFCSGSEVDLIQAFGHRHPIVPYEYKIDTGSFLYLEDRVEEIRKRK